MLESDIHHLDYMLADAPYPGGNAQEQLVCLQSLPLYADKPSVVAIMILDVDALDNLMINIDADKRGCAFIMDSSNDVISAMGNAELTGLISYETALAGLDHTVADAASANYSVSAVPSEKADWAYVSIVREAYVIEAVSDLRKFTAALVVIACALGLALIVCFTRYHQSPLIRLS